MSDTSGVEPVQGMDPAQLITKLPIMETMVSSVFDQAQKPEVDEATGKEKKAPVGSSIDDLVKLGKNLTSQMEGVVSTALGIQTKADKTAQERTDAIRDSGSQDQTILDIQAAQKMKTEADNAAFAGHMGQDPIHLNKEADSLTEARLMMEQKGKIYRDSAGINPFEDPFGYLEGIITGPFKKRGFEAAKETYNEQVAAMREAQALTSDVAIRNAALDQVTTTAGAAAARKKIADDTAVKAADSEMDMHKFDMSFINPVMQASAEQFNTAIRINSAIAQEQALDMEKQKMELDKEGAVLRNAYRQDQLDMYEDKKAHAAHMDEAIASMNQTFGTSLQGFRAYEALSPGEKAGYDRLIPAAAANRTAGFTAPQAVENLSNPDVPRETNVGLDQTVGYLQHEMDKVRSQGNASGINYKALTKEGREAVDKQATDNYTASSLAGIPDENNMYSLPSLSKMIALPQVVGSDLAEALKPRAIADLRHPTKVMDVVSASIDLLDKGKAPTAVAKQIVSMYTAGSLLNNSVSQYRTVATKVLDPDAASHAYTGYKKVIPGVGVTDMVNEEQVKNMLVRVQIKRRIDEGRAKGFAAIVGGSQ